MYRIDITNPESDKLFLSINDTEYVDLIIADNVATLVSSTREILAFKRLSVVNVDEDNNFSARLPRKLLFDLITTGYLQLLVTDNELIIQFYEVVDEFSVEHTCSVTITRQNIFSGDYLDKLKLLSQLPEYTKVSVANLNKMARIGSQKKCLIDCNYGVACLHLNNTFKVFRKLDVDLNFSVSANSLLTLLKVNTDIFQYQNYLCAENAGLFVLCNTVRGNNNDSYKVILDSKASFVADLDLTYLLRVINKFKPDTNSVTVSLDKQDATFYIGNKHFNIPVMTRNLQKGKQDLDCTINIPIDILINLSKVFAGNTVHIENKRTFIQLSKDDFMIVFRG